MESIGTYLKRQREIRHVKLEEISLSTKIQPKSLTALEKDDYESLPGYVITKGFVRSYAKAIGLDAEEAMLKCEEYLRTVLKEDPEKKQRIRWASKNRLRMKRWFLFLIVTVFVAVVAYIVTGSSR